MTEGTAKMAALRPSLPDAHFECNGDVSPTWLSRATGLNSPKWEERPTVLILSTPMSSNRADRHAHRRVRSDEQNHRGKSPDFARSR
jgi:hypothetical protein